MRRFLGCGPAVDHLSSIRFEIEYLVGVVSLSVSCIFRSDMVPFSQIVSVSRSDNGAAAGAAFPTHYRSIYRIINSGYITCVVDMISLRGQQYSVSVSVLVLVESLLVCIASAVCRSIFVRAFRVSLSTCVFRDRV
jgi:hypothetical protein